MNKKKLFLLYLFTLIISSSALDAAAEKIAVVGNDSVKDSLNLDDLKQAYLLNGIRSKSGIFIQPIDFDEESPLRDDFYRRLLGRNRAQMKSYWARIIFTGKGSPPPVVKSTKEARELLKSNDAPTIVYIKESELESKDKVLLRLSE